MENAMISMLDLCPEVSDRVITVLTTHKYDIRQSRREAEVIESISLQPPDMVLLVLPRADSDAWQVLGRLRTATDVPLMVIIAEATVVDSVQAFSLGADECLVGQPAAGVLSARVDALLRRAAWF